MKYVVTITACKTTTVEAENAADAEEQVMMDTPYGWTLNTIEAEEEKEVE